METTTADQAYYLAKMRETLSLKQRNNPHYSLRAYARDIGIHPATLSQIINGKRALPVKNSENVIQRLNLGPKEKALFVESLKKKRDYEALSEMDRFILDESYYKILAEWEHFSVLELFSLPNFERTKEDICKRLDLTVNRTDVVVNNLYIAKLIDLDSKGKLLRLHTEFTTADDISNQALKDSHKEAMQMGISKIDEYEVDLRDFSSLTIAFDLTQMKEAKALIRELRLKMLALANKGSNQTEVYQMAIQFYPLTNLKKQKYQAHI